MFGKNKITKPVAADAPLNVHSIFYTIQGEGPWAGLPTIFVRFAGCNLRCFWCDTDFEQGTEYTPEELIVELGRWEREHRCSRFVLTGGEPLIQPLPALFDHPRLPKRWIFQAETAGTVWPQGLHRPCDDGNLTLVCSPKTAKVHRDVWSWCKHYKYIVDVTCLETDDGLPTASTQLPDKHVRIFRPHELPGYDPKDRTRWGTPIIWVQPMDVLDEKLNRANLEAAAAIAMRYGYRLSVQVHKLVGLP